jgi:hypothetical protein
MFESPTTCSRSILEICPATISLLGLLDPGLVLVLKYHITRNTVGLKREDNCACWGLNTSSDRLMMRRGMFELKNLNQRKKGESSGKLETNKLDPLQRTID